MIDLDETEIELLEAGVGDHDTERATGRRCTDLYKWGVILPGEDEDELKEMIGGMDITYALAPAPRENTVFTGSREDLEVLRQLIGGAV